MKSFIIFLMTCLLLFSQAGQQLQAQETDTLRKYQISRPDSMRVPVYKTKLFKATIIPAILIGYGLSTVRNNGIYSSYDAREDILDRFPDFNTNIDNPLLVAPYLELAVVNLMQIRSNNDFVNTALVTLKAEALMAAMVFGLKEVTKLERPNGEDNKAMPSGHTAQAFLAASIVHTELRHHSQWYGVGAYTIATSVGAFRMLKNKHWQSDVFVGAGIGILSSHLSYLSHRNRWGRKPFTLVPAFNYGGSGVALFINLDEFSTKTKIPVEKASWHTYKPVPELSYNVYTHDVLLLPYK